MGEDRPWHDALEGFLAEVPRLLPELQERRARQQAARDKSDRASEKRRAAYRRAHPRPAARGSRGSRERDALVLGMRFTEDGSVRMPYREMATALGVGRERAAQLVASALRRSRP